MTSEAVASTVDVLAVDDRPANLAALAAVLDPLGINLVRATAGTEALGLLPHHTFALVIVDAQMPVMDGFELARRIRTHEAHRATPIIFLTAFGAGEPELSKAYGSGAVDFVVKPFDPDVLRFKVSVFVELFRQARQIAAQARERAVAEERETELKRIDRLKDEFLAMLAHELRTPLASLLSAAETLERTAVADPEVARLHGVVRRQTAHLRRLIDDSLEIARFTEGKIALRRQSVDLRDVVERAIELSQASMDAYGIAIEVTLSPGSLPVDGDDVRLVQVVSNLVTNAAKFSPWGGRVAVSLASSDGKATVTVRDWGRGIPPDDLGKIFEPFVQAEVADTWRGGLGIGLALVKRLVALHGGTVTASSDGSGRGSEFVVTLPLEIAPGAPAQAASSAQQAGAAAELAEPAPRPGLARVLVVDDSPDVRNTIALFLELEGHAVTTAGSGHDALKEIRDSDPDVVLLDIGLPDLDGYAVAREVRAAHPSWRPRLIALTGQVGPGDRDRALQAGFDAHVAKPIDGRALLRIVTGG